jgi:hypothetical protein
MLPGVAGAVSATLYLARHDAHPGYWLNRTGLRSFVFGGAIALLAWFLLAPLLRRYAFASRSNPSVYEDLRTEYHELNARLECVEEAKRGCPAAAGHLAVVKSELGLGDSPEDAALRWTLATGYISVWKRLHRAREDLLAVLPIQEVVGAALDCRSRLRGSKIANADGFVRELELAVRDLDPNLGAYLDAERSPTASSSASAAAAASGSEGEAAASGRPNAPCATPWYRGNPGRHRSGPYGSGERRSSRCDVESSPTDVASDAPNQRQVVSRIMHTIDEYRDSRRAGLVRSRNRLFATVIFAGTVVYAVLGLALVVRVDPKLVTAGVAYYLVGGAVGLFQQLRAASAADTVTEEDYGLSTARLIHTPLFSGIAAVAGVALAVLAPVAAPSSGTQTTMSTTGTQTTTSATSAAAGPAPTTTATTSNTPQTGTPVSLKRVFDIENYPVGLVVAAVFGLTPSLLIRRLQNQAEQYKADLRGSEAGETHGDTPASSA